MKVTMLSNDFNPVGTRACRFDSVHDINDDDDCSVVQDDDDDNVVGVGVGVGVGVVPQQPLTVSLL